MELHRGGGVHRSIILVGTLAACGYLASTVRDALLATYYGGSSALDVYFIALSPTQLIGSEAASLVYLAFLPEFARAVRAGDAAAYGHLFRARLAFATKAALGVAFLLAAGSAVFTQWFAPGYAGQSALGALRMSFAILSLLIPGFAVAGVLRSSLEARGRFSAWALLPGFRSVMIILCVLLSAAHPALGWLIGGSLLGVMLAIGYAGFAGRDHRHLLSGPALGVGDSLATLPASIAPLAGAILLGTATAIVDNAFASRAGVGGVQAFALASNLLAAPQGIIGGGVATVFFPLYGALWFGNEKAVAFGSLRRSIRFVVYGLLPVVALFVTAGAVVVRIVYRHGLFTEDLALQVSHTVAGLALGQIFYATMMLLRQFLLVAGAPWAAFEAAAVFLVVKWIGNFLLIQRLGVPGIALASSIAAVITCAFLAARVLRLQAHQ